MQHVSASRRLSRTFVTAVMVFAVTIVPGGPSTVEAAGDSDLAITAATLGSTSVVAGTNQSFSVSYANNGPETADAVSVVVSLPSMTFVSAVGATCTVVGPVAECPVGPLANGATGSLTVVAEVDPSTPDGTLTANIAIALTTGLPGDDDPVGGNDSESLTFSTTREADIGVSVSAVPTVTAGTSFTYPLIAGNSGPSDASGVEVVATVPTEVSIVSVAHQPFCKPR